jgi:alkanesulfonate monooxygenase SsuD/methylene tetrahydromethanopterin reductase-like flavin-dependent oxidoreductase (luciferase family)
MFREWLDEGFRRGGRARETFDIMPMVPVVTGPDAAACRAVVKPRIALYVGGMGARGRNFYTDIARRYGYEAAAKTIQDLYLGGRKAEAEAAVPDELVDEVALCGPRERIRERLAEWKGSGVTTIMVVGDAAAVRTMAELAL